MNLNIFNTTPRSTDQIVEGMFLPSGYHYFEKFYLFCIKEDATENPLCVLAIKDFQKFPSRTKRDFIVDVFFTEGSIFEVNVPKKVRSNLQVSINLENLMDMRRGNRGTQVFGRDATALQVGRTMQTTFKMPQMPTTFDSTGLLLTAMTNLCDTYSRFSSTKWTEFAHLEDRLFTNHRRMMTAMKGSGFSLPPFMLKI